MKGGGGQTKSQLLDWLVPLQLLEVYRIQRTIWTLDAALNIIWREEEDQFEIWELMAVSAVEESIMWNPTIPQEKKQTLIGLENLANVQQRILQQKKKSNSTAEQLKRRGFTSSWLHKQGEWYIIANRTHEMSSGSVSRLQRMIELHN